MKNAVKGISSEAEGGKSLALVLVQDVSKPGVSGEEKEARAENMSLKDEILDAVAEVYSNQNNF